VVLDKINTAVRDLQERIHGVQPTGTSVAQPTGKFVIENWTGVPQTVAVNGVRCSCPPGRTEVTVPYGTVTTELVGFETAKQWTDWKRRNGGYEMSLEIKF
jgi:hypothetical protein